MLRIIPVNFFPALISPAFVLLPVAIAAWRYKNLIPALKCIAFYLFLSPIATIIARLLIIYTHNSMPLFHVFTLVEFVCYTQFYKYVFGAQKFNKFATIAITLFVILCVINIIYWQPLTVYNSYPRSLEAIFIIVCCLKYFKELLDEKLEVENQKAVTIMNIGTLIYFSSSFLLFVFNNLILADKERSIFIWNIHAAFVIIMYIIYAIGFYHAKRSA